MFLLLHLCSVFCICTRASSSILFVASGQEPDNPHFLVNSLFQIFLVISLCATRHSYHRVSICNRFKVNSFRRGFNTNLAGQEPDNVSCRKVPRLQKPLFDDSGFLDRGFSTKDDIKCIDKKGLVGFCSSHLFFCLMILVQHYSLFFSYISASKRFVKIK